MLSLGGRSSKSWRKTYLLPSKIWSFADKECPAPSTNTSVFQSGYLVFKHLIINKKKDNWKGIGMPVCG